MMVSSFHKKKKAPKKRKKENGVETQVAWNIFLSNWLCNPTVFDKL
jgi:hypothetical protein